MNTRSTLVLPSPAKLNRFLHIIERRPDGYHNLQTLFQFITLADQLTFEQQPTPELTITSNHRELNKIAVEDNLIYKAAKLLQHYSQCQLGAHIVLDKKIPTGAGLGGGSSNAATTLLALNHLWNLNLKSSELQALGRQLGADVPVFIYGHTAWAEGIGEQLHAVEIDNPWYLVINPGCHIATSEIFSHPRLTRGTQIMTIADFLKQGGHNDCEHLVRKLYPQVDSAMKWLAKFAQPQLTGTGACVFSAFDQYETAQTVFEKLPKKISGFVTQGCTISATHEALALV